MPSTAGLFVAYIVARDVLSHKRKTSNYLCVNCTRAQSKQPMSHAKRLKTTAGNSSARSIASAELKAAGGRDSKVPWDKIPTDVLMRSVATFLRVAEATQLQTTERRLAATIKPGAVAIPVVELGDDDFHWLDDDPDQMAAYNRHIHVWSLQTKELTLGGLVAEKFNWFRADTFLRLNKLHMNVWTVTPTTWQQLMTYCPQLHHLVIQRWFYEREPWIDWKLAEKHEWTVVRFPSLPARSSEFCTAFSNRRLQVLEQTSGTLPPLGGGAPRVWTMDASEAFVAKLQATVFRRWSMDIALEAKSADEHILFLLQALPKMELVQFGDMNRPVIEIATLEAMLATWSCLTVLPPAFVAVEPDSVPPTLRLPAKRAWTEMNVTSFRGFSQWSLQHLLPMVQRSDQWSSIVWDRFAPDEVLDSKMFSAVVDQLKAPVHRLVFDGPVLPSHESIARLGLLSSVHPRREIQFKFGPPFGNVEFGNHLLAWDATPRTNLTSASLLEFLVQFNRTNPRQTDRVYFDLTYAPLQETTNADLFAIFYTERVRFDFWLPTTHLARFRAAYPQKHPIFGRFTEWFTRELFTFVRSQ